MTQMKPLSLFAAPSRCEPLLQVAVVHDKSDKWPVIGDLPTKKTRFSRELCYSHPQIDGKVNHH